jgi:hypothetical protein
MGQEARPWGHGSRGENDDRNHRRDRQRRIVDHLRWSERRKYKRRVTDPAVLDKLKFGDQVDMTWNTNVTVAVE